MIWPPLRVAVVDANGDDTAVWSVLAGKGSDPCESRLAGAWRGDANTLSSLHLWRDGTAVLSTQRASEALRAMALADLPSVDPDGLITELTSRIGFLQRAFEDEVSSRPKSKRLEQPRWPDTKLLALGYCSPGVEDDPAAVALANARWLARYCDAFTSVEEQRLSRPYLASIAAPYHG